MADSSFFQGFHASIRESMSQYSLGTMYATLKQNLPLYLLASTTSAASFIANGSVSSDLYFYGQSPPVYPSPNATVTDSWAAAYASAKKLVSQMNITEKISLTSGYSDSGTGCVGAIAPIERLGFPGLCLQDAGNGVRGTDFVNGYASGLSVGASWNTELAGKRGKFMAEEFRTKGCNVLLGPVVGPMGRIVSGGRNWEGFSSDPYHTGQLAGITVRGMQGTGVITSIKHLIGNEQETNRQPETNAAHETIESVSSNIDDKTMHELYLWPFVDALYAGTGNVMCSYNRLNNSYGCQNSKLLNGILKEELNFQGFVVTDWNALHTGYPAADAGLDMVMPTPLQFWGSELAVAIKNGSFSESRLDDMATRIIATWYKLGQDNGFPALGVGLAADVTKPHKIVNARNPAAKSTIYDGAVEGHVLVKNIRNALPLKNVQLLSIFGSDAATPDRVNIGNVDWAMGYEVTDILRTIRAALSGDTYQLPYIGERGTIISGGGSGAVTPAYWNSPYDALQQRAYEDGSSLLWDFRMNDTTTFVDPSSDAAIVFINAWASEGYDRPGLQDDYSDGLVKTVASQHNNTIVVIHNAGIRLVDSFADNPNVTAIIFAHVPGQDSGRAITHLLYGDENFSGKLPYTVAKNDKDYGPLNRPDEREEFFRLFPQSNFTEGVYIDYKYFDKHNITPRYAFGYGLSYTTFNLSTLSITSASPGNTGAYPTSPRIQGGRADLWDSWYFIDVAVTNTGKVAGNNVAQLYIGIPGGPQRQLRGFLKTALQPGESRTVRFTLTRRDLSTWDTSAQEWLLQSGEYGVWVGESSRDLPLYQVLRVRE